MKKRTGESMKDLMLGEESYKKKSTSKPVRQYASKPARQQVDKPAKRDKVNKKATYYIDPVLIKKLKYLAVEKEKDLSSLVNKAIEDLIKKFK